MKKRLNKLKTFQNRIIPTILVAVLLCGVFATMIGYIYNKAEKDGFENLHNHTKEIKQNITLQLLSDRENLLTLARLAAKFYETGESLDLLVNSFKAIGLIDTIGILQEDNMVITKNGILPAAEGMNFADEIQKQEYISGRVKSVINPNREVVRSAVPIVSGGKTVAVLYGTIDLDKLREHYYNADVQLFVIARGTGNFIIDTKQGDTLGNIESLSTRKYQKHFSYQELKNNIITGEDGFSSFVSALSGNVVYLHYAPLGISDWTIMLSMPEKAVFTEMHNTGKYLVIMFAAIVLIMISYLLCMFYTERKQSSINRCASKIRKLLLEINQQTGSIQEALREISSFSRARSSFYVNTEGEFYNYLMPALQHTAISEQEKKLIISKLFQYARKKLETANTKIQLIYLPVDSVLSQEDLALYQCLKTHGIKNLTLVSITNHAGTLNLLGVINSRKNSSLRLLLSEIAICFSMAIHNKKYLSQTEILANTDSLTGLSNRLAYKKDILSFNQRKPKNFSCIYIDVNELHNINNRLGHSAGDDMLVFIANTLREVFYGHFLYRLGGDEFLLFTENLPKKQVLKMLSSAITKIEEKDYHISAGLEFCDKNEKTEELVALAEHKMYEVKAKYYLKKEEQTNLKNSSKQSVDHIVSGNHELDAVLSVMGLRYLGIYCVSLETDTVKEILMPAYLKQFLQENKAFTKSFSQYIYEMVATDDRRAMLNFLKLDAMAKMLADGHIPSIVYQKIGGERFRLSVYPVWTEEKTLTETIWMFEREVVPSAKAE